MQFDLGRLANLVLTADPNDPLIEVEFEGLATFRCVAVSFERLAPDGRHRLVLQPVGPLVKGARLRLVRTKKRLAKGRPKP